MIITHNLSTCKRTKRKKKVTLKFHTAYLAKRRGALGNTVVGPVGLHVTVYISFL